MALLKVPLLSVYVYIKKYDFQKRMSIRQLPLKLDYYRFSVVLEIIIVPYSVFPNDLPLFCSSLTLPAAIYCIKLISEKK